MEERKELGEHSTPSEDSESAATDPTGGTSTVEPGATANDEPGATATDHDTTTTRRTVLTVGAAALAASAGCLGGDDDGGGDDGGGGQETVDMITDLEFDPDSLQIDAGTTVIWETVGSVEHTVTAYEDEIPDGAEYFASGGFDSESAARDDISGGLVAEGETYEHTFEVEGTYEYFCIPHEGAGMTGTIEVG